MADTEDITGQDRYPFDAPSLYGGPAMLTTHSPSRSRATIATIQQTYDRRASNESGTLAPEIQDAIVRCNPGGCAVTSEEVEKNLSVSYPVIPGSLKFTEDAWTGDANSAVFTVRLRGGGSILGQITIKAVVEERKVTAYSDIRILNVTGHPVPLGPKGSKESGPETVVGKAARCRVAPDTHGEGSVTPV